MKGTVALPAPHGMASPFILSSPTFTDSIELLEDQRAYSPPVAANKDAYYILFPDQRQQGLFGSDTFRHYLPGLQAG